MLKHKVDHRQFLEIEGFFNLLLAHTLSLFPEPDASRERITPILNTVSSSTSDSTTLKYRMFVYLSSWYCMIISKWAYLDSPTYLTPYLENRLYVSTPTMLSFSLRHRIRTLTSFKYQKQPLIPGWVNGIFRLNKNLLSSRALLMHLLPLGNRAYNKWINEGL